MDEFETTAETAISNLDAIKVKISECTERDKVEDMKLESAPEAATLISHGDSLVLETHGKSPVLSQRVMKIQFRLRDKFREMKNIG